MIIIIEGIDRAGKTTLCNMLANKYGFPIFKDDQRYMYSAENRVIDVNTEKLNSALNMIERKCVDNIIFDRFHLTEYVYGVCDRKYINKHIEELDKRLAADPRVLMILVNPIDIDRASEEHGSNLKSHMVMYNTKYNESKIKNKRKCTRHEYNRIIEWIDEKISQ